MVRTGWQTDSPSSSLCPTNLCAHMGRRAPHRLLGTRADAQLIIRGGSSLGMAFVLKRITSPCPGHLCTLLGQVVTTARTVPTRHPRWVPSLLVWH